MYVTRLDRSDIPKIIDLSQDLGLCMWTASSLAHEISRPDSIMLRLCDDNGTFVGFAAGRTINPEDGVVELFNIGVQFEKQGGGSGQILLDRFVNECVAIGSKRILLEVRVSNARAIQFYIKNGFVKLGLRPGFYSNPTEDGFTMQLVLQR